MDMVTDPRLQQFPFDSNGFPFPHQQSSSEHTDQYDSGLSYGIPLHHRAQEQDWNNSTGIPQHIHGNANTLSNVQASPQPRLRNVRNSQQPPLNSHTRQTASPKPRTAQRNEGLVFKNASSNFPQGVAVPSTQSVADDSSIYLPLTQANDNAGNYFAPDQTSLLPTNNSTVDPNLEPLLLDTRPTSTTPNKNNNASTDSSANPFSDTFPLVPDPPDLALWRHKLFNIDTPLHLTEAQFLTYFPHIDNVYSHRSTQKYKRKPFVSHYWDCRLKGRPSGTKKSDDPNKKKRKREKRERDLCDVKIKITEWFGEAEAREMGLEMEYPVLNGVMGEGLQIVMDGGNATGNDGPGSTSGSGAGFALLEPAKRFPPGHPGAEGKRWYTIQRVNGTAQSNAATGLGDDDMLNNTGGAAGDDKDLDHKHTLDESDRIKKNSVQRWLLKEEKEKKTAGKKKPADSSSTATSTPSTTLSALAQAYGATGLAYSTQTNHSAPAPTNLTFFGNAYCPFAQRIWIALEVKGLAYQYVECLPLGLVDLSASQQQQAAKKQTQTQPPLPKELLEVNPEGNIPCIRHGTWAIWESSVMMEYLEDLEGGTPENGVASLLPPRGRGMEKLRAHCRLWVDHLERKVLPAFYAVLLMPPPTTPLPQDAGNSARGDNNETESEAARRKQEENREMLMQTLQQAIAKLVNASHATGPFFLGESISYVDVAFAPWIIRLSRVLERYRGWNNPEMGTRWQSWVNAVEGDDRVRRTVSKDESYHSVYRGVGEDGWDNVDWARNKKKSMLEMTYARDVIRREGFGLGGDLYGRLGADPQR